ncbi:MAG: molybdenum cofactor guanylyltransferase [Candidatus Hydrogenedentes bacterium]|nr:molybdenum cofactor guanylyltransferase [Candidatus Hydrogenedentota bacterium]
MIGSAGINSGKTEFACSVVRKFRATHPIVGVKVTAIDRNDGKCPRGGEGCGVCSSLQRHYLITEEVDTGGGKDTERLVAAGASKVLWLRVLKAHLEEGRDALFEAIGDNALVVCESNTLRKVVDPGLFLMFRHRDAHRYKASAEAVRKHADRVVTFSGHGIDFDLDDLDIVGNRWALRYPAAAVILAGGESRRMQQDKSMMPIQGRPMIEHVSGQLKAHFAQVIISANDKDKYAFLDLEIVPDAEPGLGPMMGIASALEASQHDLNLFLACDIPQFDITLIRRMLREAQGYDAVVPVVEGGHTEPLFAVYRKSMLSAFQSALSQGARKIIDAFPSRNINYLHLGDSLQLQNLNTKQDYTSFVSQGHLVGDTNLAEAELHERLEKFVWSLVALGQGNAKPPTGQD